jgi:1-deoxy-D-xylulose-5-phosphate synthase
MPQNPQIPNFPTPDEITQLNLDQLSDLCSSLRSYIIDSLLIQGGHFAANLGVIELTVALLNQFNTLTNPVIWDVGHQCYPYKILTNRKHEFSEIRTFNGISGFPKISESPYDHFGTGHSSTSISAVMGMAVASKIQGENLTHFAIIGDGALTGGMAFEALNNILNSKLNIVIILNDNNIGIDPNTGAINHHLVNNHQIQSFFEWYGLEYVGPLDGHNLNDLLDGFKKIKESNLPRILHIKTTKGKGYEPAEKEQTRWHSTPKYDKFQPEGLSQEKPKKWSDAFGQILLNNMRNNERIIGISPAMISSCGMNLCLNEFPDRVFDVGISEQHALTFAAGAAKQGLLPVVNIYSTFLQRAYDQLIHDIALQNLPVLMCIDRAGLVGEDGPTHHGVFDLSFMLPIPNLTLFCPNSEEELQVAIDWYLTNQKPCAIRYPRGTVPQQSENLPISKGDTSNSIAISPNSNDPQPNDSLPQDSDPNRTISNTKQNDIAVISCGNASNWVTNSVKSKAEFDHFHFNQIKPINVNPSLLNYKHIITLEDGSVIGGFGQWLKHMTAIQYPKEHLKIQWIHKGMPDQFVQHGAPQELLNWLELDSESLIKLISTL